MLQIISWRKNPSYFHFPFQEISLALGKSFQAINRLQRLPYPFIEEAVKLIAHPPQLAAVLLGRPQGGGR